MRCSVLGMPIFNWMVAAVYICSFGMGHMFVALSAVWNQSYGLTQGLEIIFS